MGAKYEPSVIQQFAADLDSQAGAIIRTAAIRAASLGPTITGGICAFLAVGMYSNPIQLGAIGGLIGVLVGGIFGRDSGRRKAFHP